MNWDYQQVKRDWFDTEASKFLRESELNGQRVANAIMRHYVYQFNPDSGNDRTWKMKGTVEELELIASDELSVTGVGDVGREQLQEVLNETIISERGNSDQQTE